MNEAQLSLGVSEEGVFGNISNGLDVKQCIFSGRSIIASILEEIERCENRAIFLVSNVPAKILVLASQELAKLGKTFSKETHPRAFEEAFRVYVSIPASSVLTDLLPCRGTAFVHTSGGAVECSFVLEYRIAKVAPGIVGWIHINYIPKISGGIS